MVDKQKKKKRKTRIEKAQLLLKAGKYPVRLGAGDNYYVPSQSNRGKYFVTKLSDGWSCDCLDFLKRQMLCKHIYAVILWKSQENKPIDKPKTDEELVETYVCKFCKSWNIIRYGKAGNKQVYYCKDCNRRFVNNQLFEKIKYEPKIIALTLDLYFKGISLRKIADHLKQFYSLSISHVTIYYWIERYISIMNEYVSKLEPKALSDVWHIDEMQVKIAGDWKWVWNSMDDGTRYQLAEHISKERGIIDARNAFKKAKNNDRHHRPKCIITDGLPSYIRAVKKEFAPTVNRVKHIHNVGIRDRVNNNVMERLHGTHRERNKVQRGLKKEDTLIIPGQRIYYNFIKPHQSLGGATPSQVAGVELPLGENKWLDLMKKSLDTTKNLTP